MTKGQGMTMKGKGMMTKVSVEQWATISGSAGYRPMNGRPWTQYGITMARSTGHPRVWSAKTQSRGRLRSTNLDLWEEPSWISAMGYPYRLPGKTWTCGQACIHLSDQRMWSCTFRVNLNFIQVLGSDNVKPPHVLCKGQVSLMECNIRGMNSSADRWFDNKWPIKELSGIIEPCKLLLTNKMAEFIAWWSGQWNGIKWIGRWWGSRGV